MPETERNFRAFKVLTGVMDLFVSTANEGKLKEIRSMVHEYFPWAENVNGRAAKEASETENTFLGNAKIKAEALFEELYLENRKDSFCVLADDSGLCVDALGGQPGVLSARYAGDHVSSAEHIKKLLLALKNFPKIEDRTAHYACALYFICFKKGTRSEYFSEGQVQGWIGFENRGNSGFGYDPVFLEGPNAKSFAELNYEEKNRFSHRRRAFENLAAQLSQAF